MTQRKSSEQLPFIFKIYNDIMNSRSIKIIFMAVLEATTQGQITIPIAWRKELGYVYQAKRSGRNIILEPMYTEEDFFDELDKRLEDCKNGDSIPLEKVKELINIKSNCISNNLLLKSRSK